MWVVCYNSSLREHVIVNGLEVNNNGERFHNFFNTQKLSVLNTWFSHRRCGRITWHFPDGVTKKIYNFILSCSWIRQYVKNWRVHNSFDFDNDRRLVVADLWTPSTKTARFRKRSKKSQSIKLNIHTLKNENIRTTFKDKALVKSINEVASNTLPKKVNSKLYQPWHDDDINLNNYMNRKTLLLTLESSQKENSIVSKILLK